MKELVNDSDFFQYLAEIKDHLPVEVDGNGKWLIEDISGNINRVKRVHSPSDTNGNANLIVKHVPFGGKLARFPSITFSDERLDFEHNWFKLAKEALSQNNSDCADLPEIYHFDSKMRVLVMEDFGALPLNKKLEESAPAYVVSEENLDSFNSVARSIATIHNWSINRLPKNFNQASNQNRPYLFSIHLEQPESIRELWQSQDYQNKKTTLAEKLDLQKTFLKKDAAAVAPILEKLSSSFLDKNNSVYCHGDLHTGSLIFRNSKLAIIDAELSDRGPAQFDIGFLIAHLLAALTAKNIEQKSALEKARAVANTYIESSKLIDQADRKENTILKYTGAEILRRLLGPAPFNHNLDLDQHKSLLDLSLQLLTKKIK